MIQAGRSLNCDDRLAARPAALPDRMAALAGLDRTRVRLWLFAGRNWSARR